MKKLILSFLFSYSILTVFTQVPSLFKYQSVVRKSDGSLLINQNISLRITILSDSINGPAVFAESHSCQTNSFGLINLNIGSGLVETGSINSIDWSRGAYFIKTELDETGGTNFNPMGTNQLLPVPFAMYSDKTNTKAKFEINGTNQLSPDSALFEVKDRNGRLVFAVYEDGAEVIVNSGTKGARGGFTVGGKTTAKGDTIQDIMRVTPDSVRVYIDNSLSKGARSGFAVGGRTQSKGGVHPSYLHINQDSARIFTRDTIAGFKVATLKENGSGSTSYMHLNPLNYFIGQNSGDKATPGDPNWFSGKFNSTMGFKSAMNLTSGQANVLIGYNSGVAVTTGSYNTAAGAFSLYANTTGNANTAFGTYALQYNVTGGGNVATGFYALSSNTDGYQNTASGSYSLSLNTVGNYNTAVGFNSLASNIAGNNNTAMGVSALDNNSEGNSNTAFGHNSLYQNLTGYENTASGWSSLFSNTNGNLNTATGSSSLYFNTTGSYNVANGFASLHLNTTGSFNTAIGEYALSVNDSGSQNTAIGASAGSSTNNLTNSTAIGYAAQVDASNKVVIGNANVNSIGGYAAWTSFSDKRLKENILYQDRLGLNFINKLHTASYSYKADKSKRHRDGLIAQDVQQTLNELGLEFSGLVVDSDSAKTLNLSYSEFVLPLINSVQELSKQNEELRQKNVELENDIKEIKSLLKANFSSADER